MTDPGYPNARRDPDRPWLEMEIELPGTPEEVWDAIATGPGISSWFVPTRADEREGGSYDMRFGPGMDSASRITAWEPPHRMAAEEDTENGVFAAEWLVEARSGGTCVLRMINEYRGDDDPGFFDDLTDGWQVYLHVLHLRLARFGGMPSAILYVAATTDEPADAAWARLAGELGLAGARPGDRVEAPGPGFAGVVDGARPRDALVLVDAPVPGIALAGVYDMGEASIAMLRIYLFGDDAQEIADRDEPAWRDWLGERFGTTWSAAEALAQ